MRCFRIMFVTAVWVLFLLNIVSAGEREERNCTMFDKTDVVTKWLSKGKRSMSMFLRVLSSGRIAWNGNRDDVTIAVRFDVTIEKHLIYIDHTADVTVTYAAASLKVYKTTELRGPQQNQALVCLNGKVSNVFRNALCKIAV